MLRRRLVLAPALVILLALAGCVAPAADVAPAARPDLPEGRPSVVIAVIDTGINVYHAEYRREALDAASLDAASLDAATAALAALPEGVRAAAPAMVPLSLDVDDWKKAVDADMERLMAMEPETLYAFPGTKVVGAISFNRASGEWPLILDRPGYYTHGTMTTSRATGNTVSIAGDDPDVHLVLVQGFGAEAVRWAAEQDWIDVISISAGISPVSVVPGVPNALDNGGIEAYNFAAHRKPFFASSGNGVANAGLLGFPSWMRGSSGVPNAISVGANDNAYLSHWHNQDPYVSADGCANPAAAPGSTDDVTNTGGGTSSATPFSAGGGAKLILEARRLLGDTHVGVRLDESLEPGDGWDSLSPVDHQLVLARGEPGLVASGPLADGVFTQREFKDVLYHTALVAPTDDESDGDHCQGRTAGTYVPGDALPEDARFPFQGYGEINHASVDAALAVLRGEADLPARPGADAAYVEAHHRKVLFVGDEE